MKILRTTAWLLLVSLACHISAPLAAIADPPAAAPPAKTTAPAAPAKEPTLPPALTHYMGREIAPAMGYQHAAWLIRPSRQKEEDCTTLLTALHFKPGQIVCDLGCGNGFYTLKIAPQLLPGGKVLAVDIQPEMLQMLNESARQAKVDNFEPVLGTIIDPRLPAGKVDLVLCVDAYHEFSHPVHMLREIRKSLAPHGRLVLVEFRAEDPNVPIRPLHKMTKAQAEKELTANGYKLVEQFDKLPWQHVLYFERDENWKEPAKE